MDEVSESFKEGRGSVSIKLKGPLEGILKQIF